MFWSARVIIKTSFDTNYYFNSSLGQITGGSSGIGKALAAEALNRGAAVVTIVARNEVLQFCSMSCRRDDK